MLRVGFLFQGGDGWLGGVNYLRNLLYAVGRYEPSIRPVVIAPFDGALHGVDRLDGIEVHRVIDQGGTLTQGLLRTYERRLHGRDERLVRFAEQLELDVLSHSGTFGWRFPIPALPWIPDLQHHRLPQNFSALERAQRTYIDVTQLAEGTTTIVSSACAQQDCRRFYGPLARRTEVLRFVSQPQLDVGQPSREVLRAKYALPERWLFLPNQMWRHKNHAVVIEALELLARDNVRPVVVMTGKAADYRAPRHHGELMQRIVAAGLEQQLPHLGLVPFSDVSALARHSIAIINPSLFEGWSTTVEEARSLGKATILSDIGVHREQAPPGAAYFLPHDADALARLLEAAWISPPSALEEAARVVAARDGLEERTRAFAARYRTIVVASAQ